MNLLSHESMSLLGYKLTKSPPKKPANIASAKKLSCLYILIFPSQKMDGPKPTSGFTKFLTGWVLGRNVSGRPIGEVDRLPSRLVI